MLRKKTCAKTVSAMIEFSDNRIICAANKLSDGTLILGVRHCDAVMHKTREQLNIADTVWFVCEQGFIDKFGQWKTRKEAWVIACQAKQITRLCGGQVESDYERNDVKLYSENLY